MRKKKKHRSDMARKQNLNEKMTFGWKIWRRWNEKFKLTKSWQQKFKKKYYEGKR